MLKFTEHIEGKYKAPYNLVSLTKWIKEKNKVARNIDRYKNVYKTGKVLLGAAKERKMWRATIAHIPKGLFAP